MFDTGELGLRQPYATRCGRLIDLIERREADQDRADPGIAEQIGSPPGSASGRRAPGTATTGPAQRYG
jgi:hypothetical protein